MSVRRDNAQVRARVLGELTRRIGTALADERLVRNDNVMNDQSDVEERRLARITGAAEMARIRAQMLPDGQELSTSEEYGLIDEAIAKVLGLGRLDSLLDDDDISDIHVRGCSPVWIRLRDGRREQREPIVDSDEDLVELVRRASTRLTANERRFDAANPEVNLQLPDGSRMFATMEISQRPSLVVRKHRFEYSSLDVLQRSGMFPSTVGAFLSAAVRARRNIIIAGGTGSGKTTLLRALLNEVPAADRIVTIEDAYELGIDRMVEQHPDHDALQARPANIEGQGAITLADLTRMALRMDPDRVIVGEVRGAEAFPMLMAMSQGNNGSMCTMHADSARSVFPKLAAYVSMASTGLPVETINMIMSEALHLVVHIEIVEGRRRISTIREIVGADGNNIISNEVYDFHSPMTAFNSMRASNAEHLENYGFDARRLVPAQTEPW